jgi:hypothetical protein
MQRRLLTVFIVVFALTGFVCAQGNWASLPDHPSSISGLSYSAPSAPTTLPSPTPTSDDTSPPTIAIALPRMAPELALQAYRGRTIVQAAQLASYSATTIIHADLLDTRQSGEYEVVQRYSSPHQLSFKAVRFSGDNFVKSNVILRVLQSEVDHVQKDDPAANAISPANYKFSYKGIAQLGDRMVHVYQVKPRQKRTGLFKGKIYLDVFSGSMVRAEGKPVKSPSLFVKKLEFVQDYADIGPFTFPVHIHSEAQARIVGRTVVDVYHSDYQPVSSVTQAKLAPSH